MATRDNELDRMWMVLDELEFVGIPRDRAKEIKQRMEGHQDRPLVGTASFPMHGQQQGMVYQIRFEPRVSGELLYPSEFRAELPPTKEGMPRGRDFAINPDAQFTLQQAFNLLHGNAVNLLSVNAQTRRMEQQWQQLDLMTRNEKGDPTFKLIDQRQFDLGGQLDKLGAPEMKDPNSRINILLGLHNGNAERLSLEYKGATQSAYAVADPARQTFRLLDSRGNELDKQKFLEHAGKPAEKSTRIIDQPEGRTRMRKGRAM